MADQPVLDSDVLIDHLRGVGPGRELVDAMQAGICLEAGAPLVTRNARHFERVTGLEIASPQEWLARLSGA